MSFALSPPLPGWWQRTWPIVALGMLSVAMWTGRIRNILGDESLVGAGRVFRLVLAVSFVTGGVAVLVACWVGWRARNWRQFTRREADGWRVGPGIPTWGASVAAALAAWTGVVWTVQGIGILIDPNHDLGFKVVHTFLMAGSLVVAGTAGWGLRRSWPVAPPTRIG
jgi:hypothetical protein